MTKKLIGVVAIMMCIAGAEAQSFGPEWMPAVDEGSADVVPIGS